VALHRPIQSNKTRPIAENFDWVHGIDRPKIAERLYGVAPDNMPALQVCIQVNVSAKPARAAWHRIQSFGPRADDQAPTPSAPAGLMAIPEPTPKCPSQIADATIAPRSRRSLRYGKHARHPSTTPGTVEAPPALPHLNACVDCGARIGHLYDANVAGREPLVDGSRRSVRSHVPPPMKR